ncbi:MAG TPA: ABC transporter permease [Flexilinea sp.]|nr:ABC transporter permease [Flexilinea sp.]
MESNYGITVQGLLAAAVRMATPLLLAGLGGLFSAKSGIVSMFLEGFMLVGAFMGFLGSVLTGSAHLGILFAIAGGMLMGLIMAVLAVSGRANQTILGVGINIFALGITSYFQSVLFGSKRPTNVSVFYDIPIPGLSKIPYIGAIFNNSLFVYAAFLLVPVVWYVLYRTPAGLAIRAVGENPDSVATLGGNVIKIRYCCLLIAGALAGLGGASLTIGQTGQFMENISSGRGYIALAAMIFGRFSPIGVLIGSLLFGFADGLQLRMQTAGTAIPYQLLSMMPYVVTILALVVFVKKSMAPAAMGRPYTKQK